MFLFQNNKVRHCKFKTTLSAIQVGSKQHTPRCKRVGVGITLIKPEQQFKGSLVAVCEPLNQSFLFNPVYYWHKVKRRKNLMQTICNR